MIIYTTTFIQYGWGRDISDETQDKLQEIFAERDALRKKLVQEDREQKEEIVPVVEITDDGFEFPEEEPYYNYVEEGLKKAGYYQVGEIDEPEYTEYTPTHNVTYKKLQDLPGDQERWEVTIRLNRKNAINNLLNQL